MHSVTVVSKQLEAEGIYSFRLRSENDSQLPTFSAGSHIDVHVAGLIRQYSLWMPHERAGGDYMIGVLREPESRGGSHALCDEVGVGDHVTISDPRNHFELEPDGPAILIAGGIGITPILCMAAELWEQSRDFELHYCVRSQDRAAFLSVLTTAPWADRAHLHLDDGEAVQLFQPERVLSAAAQHATVYVCGPTGFLDFVDHAAARIGMEPHRVRREYFKAKDIEVSEDSFEVEISSTGQRFTIPPDKSVVSVLAEQAGIDIPTSCQEGICGTCITVILDGVPDHADSVLSDGEKEANDQFTPCCSRAKTSKLVLDL